MTKKQLEDLIAFISWAMKTKKDEGYILLNVLHDLCGIANKDVCFLPRTHGYAKVMKDMENKEMADAK